MTAEKALRKLLIKATRDKELRERFLNNPERIAKEFGVSFTKEQIEKVTATAQFIESIEVIRFPINGVTYPLYNPLFQWKVEELLLLLRDLFFPIPIPGPIGYPPPPMRWFHRGIWRR